MTWRYRLRLLWRADSGVAMLEFAMIAGLLLTVTCGMVDFSLALYQYNAASKAAELGARIAATSNPVSSGISSLSPTAAFSQVCSGATASCTGGGTYVATAMQAIVYGQGNTSCANSVAAGRLPAMCDIYAGLTTANVTVTYEQSAYATSGLGYAGRAGGPVPTITVELSGLTFNFFFLNSLLGLAPMSMPTMKTTITGEDLSSAGS